MHRKPYFFGIELHAIYLCNHAEKSQLTASQTCIPYILHNIGARISDNKGAGACGEVSICHSLHILIYLMMEDLDTTYINE